MQILYLIIEPETSWLSPTTNTFGFFNFVFVLNQTQEEHFPRLSGRENYSSVLCAEAVDQVAEGTLYGSCSQTQLGSGSLRTHSPWQVTWIGGSPRGPLARPTNACSQTSKRTEYPLKKFSHPLEIRVLQMSQQRMGIKDLSEKKSKQFFVSGQYFFLENLPPSLVVCP